MVGSKIILACLFVAAVAFALPEDEFTEDSMVQVQAEYETAHNEVSQLLAAGKTQDECMKLSEATIAEVTTSASSMQKVMDSLDDGSKCAKEMATPTTAAKDAKKKADDKAASAKKAAEKAAKAPVKFADISIGQVKANDCSAFQSDPAYTSAKKAADAANKKYAEAKGEAAAAKKALDNAVDAQKAAIKYCACHAQYTHKKATSNVKQPDASAWKKAQLMKCVLKGTSPSSCSVPAVPKITIPKLAPPASTENCNGHSPTPPPTPAPKYSYAKNVFKSNAGKGGWGGSCTCPDGQVYQVGDNMNSCGSLACNGGKSGTCHRKNGAWSKASVSCGAKFVNPCPASYPYALEWKNTGAYWCYKKADQKTPCHYSGSSPPPKGKSWGTNQKKCPSA
jgi:hypothetical protein